MSQGMGVTSRKWESGETVSSRAPRKNAAHRHLHFRASDFQGYKVTHRVSPAMKLWQFVTAATGNLHSQIHIDDLI